MFQNLPGGYFNDIVRIFLSLELTLTFPIVIKPATDVVEEILYNSLMVSVQWTIKNVKPRNPAVVSFAERLSLSFSWRVSYYFILILCPYLGGFIGVCS